MIETAIKTLISLAVSGVVGYLIGRMKSYKKKIEDKKSESEILKTALMTLLQSNLTNTYFVYEKVKEIPDYIYKNWLNSFKIYKQLDGNDYCDTLKHKMENWNFVNTDILK